MGHAVVMRCLRSALLLCAGASIPLAAQGGPGRAHPEPPSAAIAALIRSLSRTSAVDHDRALLQSVVRFYTDQRFEPAWTDARGFTQSGERLTRAIATAADDGLDPGAYPVVRPDRPTPAALAHADVQLSYVALRFAEDLGVGLTVPGAVNRDNAFVRRSFRGDSLLHALFDAPDPGRALLEIAPRTLGYRRLREALHRLRAIERRGGWESMPRGPTLRRGMSGSRVAQLRALLRERGDLVDGAGGDRNDTTLLFDEALATAVAHMQERHGLPVDSIAGNATVAALNVPVSARVEQVRLGMERARWLPPVVGKRWITVNLADYRAFVFDDSQPVFETRVVIGATNHKTPMFVDTLTTIVLNPAWNVPPSIAAKEILPKLRRDPDYLDRNHMVWVGRDIQQVPGPWNALGQIAFMFPNRFNVYMHDTPAKELFARPDRAHSHGCIRVQRPHDLAALLLEAEGWTRARLDSVIATGRRTAVALNSPVPVRITYATAFADRDGTLQFRPDVYGRDLLLSRAMAQEHHRQLPTALR